MRIGQQTIAITKIAFVIAYAGIKAGEKNFENGL